MQTRRLYHHNLYYEASRTLYVVLVSRLIYRTLVVERNCDFTLFSVENESSAAQFVATVYKYIRKRYCDGSVYIY